MVDLLLMVEKNRIKNITLLSAMLIGFHDSKIKLFVKKIPAV